MDIGKPRRIIVVEPLRAPVPRPQEPVRAPPGAPRDPAPPPAAVPA